MLYDYIVDNYEKDEPIFLAELPGKSEESIRQEMKRLTDEGKVEKLYNDVYHLSYKTILIYLGSSTDNDARLISSN